MKITRAALEQAAAAKGIAWTVLLQQLLANLPQIVAFIQSLFQQQGVQATGAACCDHHEACCMTVCLQAQALEQGLRMLESCCDE